LAELTNIHKYRRSTIIIPERICIMGTELNTFSGLFFNTTGTVDPGFEPQLGPPKD